MTDRHRILSTQALKVRQWIAAWNEVHWDPSQNRSEPPHWFYQFNLPASELRRLSGVYARTTDRKAASDDFGIQRQLDKGRSEEISRFVKFGYPWSDLSRAKRASSEFQDLRQPGWLPTSLVVNVLTSGDERRKVKIADSDLIRIRDNEDGSSVVFLPEGYSDPNWRPASLAPLEIIDGQHRLWAFDEVNDHNEFELPVVAFVGLDLSWQAYLFYTVNIKPKKINTSLAFDLYPLLRTEQWLEKFEGHAIYRETRSQELVDKLWSHPQSPWFHRINMLGASGAKGLMVNQSSWVRSLMASFVKSWEGRRITIGGIFGTKIGEHNMVLPWSSAEQTAFLIFVGQHLQIAIGDCREPWSDSLRTQGDTDAADLAFFGPDNLLNQDQGVRTVLQIFNDFMYLNADTLSLDRLFVRNEENEADDIDSHISSAIKHLSAEDHITHYVAGLASIVSTFDWRASGFPQLTAEQHTLKASFRGSGGYKELRRHVLLHIMESGTDFAHDADRILNILGYSG